jgi:hypothetical protein
MCVLCGGALTLLGVLSALSSERSQAQMTPPSSFGGAPAGGNFTPYGGASAGDGFMPYDYSAPSMGYPNWGSDSSAFPNYDTGGSDFLDSLRQSDAERSWWSEEWSRALGDNYPEPTHVDPDGNPGWVDSSGAFHDYNSGMSDYEASHAKWQQRLNSRIDLPSPIIECGTSAGAFAPKAQDRVQYRYYTARRTIDEEDSGL